MPLRTTRTLALGVLLLTLLSLSLESQAAFVRWTATGHIFDPPDDEEDPGAYFPFPEPLSFFAARGDLVQISVDIDLDAVPTPGSRTVYPTRNHLGRIGSLVLTPDNSTVEFIVSFSAASGTGTIQANIRDYVDTTIGWRIYQFAFALFEFELDSASIPTAVAPYGGNAIDTDWNRLESEPGYPEFFYSFIFDDVTATVVPVPAAVWLFGSALLLLGGRRVV